MTSENYQKAVELTAERMALKEDVEVWEKIKEPRLLMYHTEDNGRNGYITNFSRIVPEDIFKKFKEENMKRLNDRLEEIDAEFAAL